jgi:hypothetical protein
MTNAIPSTNLARRALEENRVGIEGLSKEYSVRQPSYLIFESHK